MSGLFTSIDSDDDKWYDDDVLGEPTGERFSCKSPIGMTLAQLVEWSNKLCAEYGDNAIISDLNLDDEFPSIELEMSDNVELV